MRFTRLIRLLPRGVIIPRPKNYKFSIRVNMDHQLDDKVEEVKTVQALTTKELKKLIKPEFEKNPDKYYPTTTLRDKLGFHRNQCSKCHKFFWNLDKDRTICGDSGCVGQYEFIGTGTGIGVGRSQKLTIKDVWDTYEKSFGSEKVPCTAIERYPVVARWRNDVDFVLAGIFCFQPYCVTGELEPPANPLICPQFCVRFNDLDNIGLTGRHYSGFVMLGIQAFNKPGELRMWKDECVQANYNWLTNHLKIDPKDITFMEDIWAGGGNLGPCIEYFIKGIEIGNMVFMQFKTFHDGTFEELPIKVIDTGIGLERIPWLLNGSPTSYADIFPNTYEYVTNKLGISMNNEIWKKLGPLSSRLDIDECEDIEEAWKQISGIIGEPVEVIKKAIEPLRDVFIILDHTRSLLMVISDGALPSNVGGGGNLRNILRRTFAIMKKNNWWEKMPFDDYLKIFEHHKEDLKGLYGEFKPYPSFNNIIRIEFQKWESTDTDQKAKLDKLLKKKAKMDIDDWIVAMTSWGIPADAIAQISGQEIPPNLYYEIATRQERVVKAAEQILYNTQHLPATKNLYYVDHKMEKFPAKIVDIFANVKQKNLRNIVILDQSAFYPTSGGQQHDTGSIHIGEKEYKIVDGEKVGHCVLHILDREVEGSNDELIGKDVICTIDHSRREQLRNHHTATHIVFAASRKVLGPHVWQHGAKKTVNQAHLDITHYAAVTNDELLQIQDAANRIVMSGRKINKSLMEKSDAEKKFGFSLYQGGVVPGNELRIVNIEGTDVEACCGTHCDNTNEVGWIKMIASKKVADGTVRLYFVAGERTLACLNEETKLITELSDMWGEKEKEKIVSKARDFFKDHKKLKTVTVETSNTILTLQMRYFLDLDKLQKVVILSNEDQPTFYFSGLPGYAKEIKVS
jgi:alanyl-tRNA synthetase